MYSLFPLHLIIAQFLGYMGDKRHVTAYFSVRQHNTAEFEYSGATERLAIFPKIFYSLQNKIVCVCLCLTAFPDTCVLFYGSVGADLYQFSLYFPWIALSVYCAKFCFGIATCSRSLCYCSYQQTDVEPAKCYSRFLACWLQKAVGLELPKSHYPVPLFYEDCYARWLSVAGTWHLPRCTLVVDRLHRNPVRERTTGKFSTSIYKYTNCW
jgi:hypothetical protein